MKESIKSIIEWSEQVFPDATLDGQWEKLDEEHKEWESSDNDISELADMFIVACSIARFSTVDALSAFGSVRDELQKAFVTWSTLEKAVNEKMQTNRARSWEKRDGQYKHKS